MIWAALLFLAVLVSAYLLQPFFAATGSMANARLAEAKAQRAVIDLDEAEGRLTANAAAQARDALDRRILAVLDAAVAPRLGGRLRTAAVFLVPAILVLGTASVYVRIGRPAYERISIAEYQAQQVADLPQSLEGLVVELRNRLAADPNPPADGYVLLARSYLRLGDVTAGLEAYETAISISSGDDRIIAERDRVIETLRNRASAPEIDPESAARIQAMTPDEQQAMIESMVAGLATRLEANPGDAEGWARLIRARLVLGQTEQARRDFQTAKTIFTDDPQAKALLEQFAGELQQVD